MVIEMPESVHYVVLFVSDTCWCGLYAAMMCVNLVCLHAYVCYCLSVLDSNDPMCTEEGEIFEYQEDEDQVHANQGNPSKLVAFLFLVLLFYDLLVFVKMHLFALLCL
jgi:hypothetical protein